MQNRSLVVLLGNSLLLDGVALSLATRQTLGIVRMDATSGDIRQQLRNLEPDLIVFELDSPCAPTILGLVKDRPDMLFIGLDLDCSQAIVLNSRQQPTRSMSELQRVVQAAVDLRALAADADSRTTGDEVGV